MATFYGVATLQETLDSPIRGLSKGTILDQGMTVLEYNAHTKVGRSAMLVARYASMLATSEGSDDETDIGECLTATLYALADDEDASDAMTLAREATPTPARDATLEREAKSNARPGDAGNHDDPSIRFARMLAKLDIPEALYLLATEQRDGKALAALRELGDGASPARLAGMIRTLHRRAHVKLGLAPGETLDQRGRVRRPKASKPVQAPYVTHTCGPRDEASHETWATWGARNKGCQACRDERNAIPDPHPVTVSPTWGGLQGDRLADKGRWASTGQAGLGAERIATAL